MTESMKDIEIDPKKLETLKKLFLKNSSGE